MTAFQKVIKYLAIALAVFLIVSIIGGIISAVSSLSFFYGKDEVAGEMQTYDIASEISELNIDISAAELIIATGDDFKVESNHKYLTVEEKNGSLKISETNRKWNFSRNVVTIKIYIPENTVFESARIDTGAGRVEVDTLSADKLTMNLGAGEVKIENLSAFDKADIDTGAGSITVKGGAIANLDADLGVGEFNLTSRLTGNCDIDCGVGSSKFNLLGSQDDYRIKLEKGLGTATVGGENVGDGTYGTGENKIDIDGGVGEIKISFKDAK